MVDRQGRIVVPKEMKVLNSEKGQVFFYYSLEEKLFYFLFKKVSDDFFIGIRQIDEKNRIFVPKQILENYQTKNILVAAKGERIYLIPLKEE